MVFSPREVNSELEKCSLKGSLNQFQLPLYDNDNNKNVKKRKIIEAKIIRGIKKCLKQVSGLKEGRNTSNNNFEKCITLYLRTLNLDN